MLFMVLPGILNSTASSNFHLDERVTLLARQMRQISLAQLDIE
jgi:hypothetical protein